MRRKGEGMRLVCKIKIVSNKQKQKDEENPLTQRLILPCITAIITVLESSTNVLHHGIVVILFLL